MVFLRSLYLAIGAASGSIFPFIVVILAGRGFGAAEIGLATAAASVAQTAAVPVWGHLGDATLGRARALQLGAIGSAVVVFFFAFPTPMAIGALLVITFQIFQSALQPLADALALARVPDRDRDYARIRLFASFSFAISSIACGVLYDRVGYWATAPVFLFCGAWIVASVVGLRAGRPAGRPVRAAHAGSTSRLGTTGEALALAPRLPLVLLAVGLVHLGVLASFTYLPLRITDLGGGPEMVALTAGISSLAEVPGMFAAGAIASRIGLRGLFSLSCLAYAACIASWIVIDSPTVIVATRAVTGFAFGGIVVASALTIGSLLPARLQATGQALSQTIAFGVAAVIANLVGGLIYAAAGPSLLWMLTCIAAVGAATVGFLVYPTRGAGTKPTDESAIALTLSPERDTPLGM